MISVMITTFFALLTTAAIIRPRTRATARCRTYLVLLWLIAAHLLPLGWLLHGAQQTDEVPRIHFLHSSAEEIAHRTGDPTAVVAQVQQLPLEDLARDCPRLLDLDGFRLPLLRLVKRLRAKGHSPTQYSREGLAKLCGSDPVAARVWQFLRSYQGRDRDEPVKLLSIRALDVDQFHQLKLREPSEVALDYQRLATVWAVSLLLLYVVVNRWKPHFEPSLFAFIGLSSLLSIPLQLLCDDTLCGPPRLTAWLPAGLPALIAIASGLWVTVLPRVQTVRLDFVWLGCLAGWVELCNWGGRVGDQKLHLLPGVPFTPLPWLCGLIVVMVARVCAASEHRLGQTSIGRVLPHWRAGLALLLGLLMLPAGAATKDFGGLAHGFMAVLGVVITATGSVLVVLVGLLLTVVMLRYPVLLTPGNSGASSLQYKMAMLEAPFADSSDPQAAATMTSQAIGGWLGHVPVEPISNYYPVAISDAALSSLWLCFGGGLVLGLLGLGALTLLRHLQAASRAPDPLDRYLIIGLTGMLGSRILLHVCANLNLGLFTGCNLPGLGEGLNESLIIATLCGGLVALTNKAGQERLRKIQAAPVFQTRIESLIVLLFLVTCWLGAHLIQTMRNADTIAISPIPGTGLHPALNSRLKIGDIETREGSPVVLRHNTGNKGPRSFHVPAGFWGWKPDSELEYGAYRRTHRTVLLSPEEKLRLVRRQDSLMGVLPQEWEGDSATLTLRRSVQRVLESELGRAYQQHPAVGAAAVVLSTEGDLLGAVSLPTSPQKPDWQKDYCRERFHPGSIFKGFLLPVIQRRLGVELGELRWATASSDPTTFENWCLELGPEQVFDYFVFAMGYAPGPDISNALAYSIGFVSNSCFGDGECVLSPLEAGRFYLAYARRDGKIPVTIRHLLRFTHGGQVVEVIPPPALRQVMTRKTAQVCALALEGTVRDPEGTCYRAGFPSDLRIGAKTGSTPKNAWCVGITRSYVVVVAFHRLKAPPDQIWGSQIAAPVVANIIKTLR